MSPESAATRLLPQAHPEPCTVAPASPLDAERVVASESIFDGAREVVIVHRGMRYRLLQTRQGKLILNK